MEQVSAKYDSTLEQYQDCLNKFKLELDNSLHGLETTLGDTRIDAASARGISYLLKSNIRAYKEFKRLETELQEHKIDYESFIKNQAQDSQKETTTLHQHLQNEQAELQAQNTQLSLELNELHQLEQSKWMELQQQETSQLRQSLNQVQTELHNMKQLWMHQHTLSLSLDPSFYSTKKNTKSTANPSKMAHIDDYPSKEALRQTALYPSSNPLHKSSKMQLPGMDTLRVSALYSQIDHSEQVFQEYGQDVSNLIRMHSHLFSMQEQQQEDDDDEDKTPFASEQSLYDPPQQKNESLIPSTSRDVATETAPISIPSTSRTVSLWDIDRLRHGALSTLDGWCTRHGQHPLLTPLKLTTPTALQSTAILLARYYLWN